MSAADTLLMLSGGIDSAFCLWQHVRSGHPIRTHHVVLINSDGRDVHESRACDAVLEWVRSAVPGAEIEHTQSLVDYGDLSFNLRDHHLWSYWTGAILSDPKNRGITKYIKPAHSDAWRGGFDSPEAVRSTTAYDKRVREIVRRKVKSTYPIRHLSKAEVVRSMPRGLLELCWWCRTPDGDGLSCHRCYTCRLVDPALK